MRCPRRASTGCACRVYCASRADAADAAARAALDLFDAIIGGSLAARLRPGDLETLRGVEAAAAAALRAALAAYQEHEEVNENE